MMTLDAAHESNAGFALSNTLPRVLLVDDDPLYPRRAAVALLGIAELRVVTSRSAAIATAVSWQPHIAILDMFLPDGDALHLPDELQRCTAVNELGVIYLAKGPGAATRFQSLDGRFFGVVHRDAGPTDLLRAIRLAATPPAKQVPSVA
jgi:DNA-binding NarL/FixJ family response regulator